MSKEQANEVPEEFKGFVTETYKDGEMVESHGEIGARKDPDWPQFTEQTEDDDEQDEDNLTADDVEEIIEDDDDADDEDDADDDDSDDEDDDGEDESSNDAADDDEAREEADRKSKRRKSVGKRIAEITAARRAAEEKAAALEAEIAALKAGKGGDDTDGNDDTADTRPETDIQPDLSDLTKPDPADDKYMFGEIDAKFMEDMAEYNAEVAFRKREAKAEAKRAQETRQQQEQAALARLEKNFVDNVVEPGKKEFDDFEDVVIEGGKAGVYQLTPTLVSLISESEAGAKIMYHFASNPDEALKVANMSVERQAAYFGRMEARFSSQEDAGKKRRAEPTRAPKPGKRRARGSGKGNRTNPATTDFAAFEKLANSR